MDKSRQKLVGILIAMMLVVAYPKQVCAFAFQDRVATAKSLAHYMTGQIYDLLGDPKRAAMAYKAASQFDPSSYLIRLRLGVDYARLNMLGAAVEELNMVGELNKDELQSHYLLALIYSSTRQFDKAAEEYEYILTTFSESDPKNIEIHGYLGQLYYSQKKYDQALKQFEQIYALEPENADIMYLLGSLYIETGRSEEAFEILNKSIKINPNHDGSLNTLAYMYAEENRNLDEALEYVKLAISLSPDNGAYIDTLGWVYFKKKEYKKALEALEDANALLKDPIILDHLGDVYMKLNKPDKAIENWEASLKLKPAQEEVTRKLNEARNNSAHRTE